VSATVLEEVVAGRVEALARSVQDWRSRHGRLSGAALEDAVAECLEYPAALKRLVRRVVDPAARGREAVSFPGSDAPEDDPNERRRSLLGRFDSALASMRTVLGDACSAGATAPDLEEAVRRTEQLKEETFRHWPEVTPQMLEEARERKKRGEGVPIDEAFAAAAGVSVEEFRRRVEERRRGRQETGTSRICRGIPTPPR
jgi:hypothetical protein